MVEVLSDALNKGSTLTAEMDGVAATKIFYFKRRDRDGFGLKFSERFLQPGEVRSIGKNNEIRVPAKLRRAVKHARLSAHEQGADAVHAHRRKDFAYRVRDQVSLPKRDKFAKASRFPASVPPV